MWAAAPATPTTPSRVTWDVDGGFPSRAGSPLPAHGYDPRPESPAPLAARDIFQQTRFEGQPPRYHHRGSRSPSPQVGLLNRRSRESFDSDQSRPVTPSAATG